MSTTKTPVEPTPLVSDEQIRAYNGDQLMDPEDVRDEYEAHLAKLIAERDELVDAIRHSALAMNVVRSSLTSTGKRQRLQIGLDKAQAVLSKYK